MKPKEIEIRGFFVVLICKEGFKFESKREVKEIYCFYEHITKGSSRGGIKRGGEKQRG